MIETGTVMRSTRENMSLSLEEVSRDLDISVIQLEQIESGAIGAFDDIYELKDMMLEYSKYLGLDVEEVEKSFNEYMFDFTSKIPMQEIEKMIQEQQEEEIDEDIIRSPYTQTYEKGKTLPYILIAVVIILLVIAAILWSVSQISTTVAQ